MARITKNQHYVPQCYINRFAENGRISVYFKENGRIMFNQNSRNYAANRHYYDITQEDLKYLFREQIELIPMLQRCINSKDSQLIEHYFSRSEAAVNNLFDKIEHDPTQIDANENIAPLVIFLHDLAYRNPAYRDSVEKINKITFDALSGINLTKSVQKKVEETYGQEQARKQQLHAIMDISPTLQTFKKLYIEYSLYFATAEKDACFLISDNPAFSVRSDLPEICFPISSKHALLFRKPNIKAPIMGTDMPVGNRISISVPNVVRYNLLQLCSASRYVFGDATNLEWMKSSWERIKYNNSSLVTHL